MFSLSFSSVCEFQFIERIGTHGKQNSVFIIMKNRGRKFASHLTL